MSTQLKPRPRKDACTPLSSHWSLYNPEDVAEKLNQPIEIVDKVLEETGFNKAVRIREDIIRWKTRLIAEQKELAEKERCIRSQLKTVSYRQKEVEMILVEIRNILRIPREKGVAS